MTVGTAIRRSRPRLPRERLIEAVRLAEARGLLAADEADDLRIELDAR
jgi:hypothetical protein